MSMTFQYYLPVNLIFGRGKVNQAAEEAAKYGKKVLVVTGRGSTKKSGLLDRVEKLLSDAGLGYEVFDKVEPNPLASTAKEGADMAKATGCEVILAVGGGSIMDCAKAIAFCVCNEGPVFDYIYGKKQGKGALPLIAVPTTCGTGSEGNCFAVLTDDSNNDKKSLRTNDVIPKASIIDPELMKTMPKHILASVGFDALCHSMEAYISKSCQPLVEIQAMYAIKLLGENLAKVYKNYEDEEGWDAIAFASTIGGMVIHHAGVAASHGLEHPASGLRNITHGRGLAALTPVIYKRSISGAPEKFAMISRLLGGKDETDCVENIEKLLAEIELTTTLSAEGVKEEDIDWMAENALKVSAVSINSHPVVFTLDEIKEIYKEAM